MVAAVVGRVYFVDDAKVMFRPDVGRRPKDARRRVVVLSADPYNTEDSWPLVHIAPVSSQEGYVNDLSVPLRKGEANSTIRCWIFMDQFQALAKADLGDRIGDLPPSKLALTQATLLRYLGLVG